MVDYNKLKVGDTVRLVSERPFGWNSEGAMDEYLNSIQTITKIFAGRRDASTSVYFRGNQGWSYTLGDIDSICNYDSITEIEPLLEEAEKRYPPGTRYWNLNRAGERSIPNCPFEDLPVRPAEKKFKHMPENGKDCIGINGYGWVHMNGIWAEVVTPVIKNDYQIY